MKKVLSLIFIAILLFFIKERLRAQCNMQGLNKVSELPDGSFEAYFTTLPGTGCIYNYGFGPVDSIKAGWTFYTHDCGSYYFETATTDTVRFEAYGTTYIACSAVYYRKNKPKAVSQLPNICVNGFDGAGCVEIFHSEPPPATTPPSPPVVVQPPTYEINGGVLHLMGSGTLVLQDWPFGAYEFLQFSENLELYLPYEHNKIQILWDDFPVSDLGVVKN